MAVPCTLVRHGGFVVLVLVVVVVVTGHYAIPGMRVVRLMMWIVLRQFQQGRSGTTRHGVLCFVFRLGGVVGAVVLVQLDKLEWCVSGMRRRNDNSANGTNVLKPSLVVLDS